MSQVSFIPRDANCGTYRVYTIVFPARISCIRRSRSFIFKYGGISNVVAAGLSRDFELQSRNRLLSSLLKDSY